jgi:hypothetical protein
MGFVLSTGRTGTVFLTHLLQQQYPKWMIVHEPSPSRGQYLLGNFSEYMPSIKGSLLKWFKISRQYALRINSGKSGYVEINPMLCPLTDIIPEVFQTLRVVHIVRNPREWVESMTQFKASAQFRKIIDYVPFNHPAARGKVGDHAKLNEFNRLIWRWKIFNENIAKLEKHCEKYVLIKFEDLVGGNLQVKQKCMSEIIQTLGIDDDPDVSWYINPPSLNVRPDKSQYDFSQFSNDKLRVVCGELMGKYGYV